MTLEEVTALDALARKRFVYRVNNVMAWRSYADDALAGKWWQGDCSDLTSTVLDLLGRNDAPKFDRYRLLVATSDMLKPDHMVGAVRCGDGAWLIVGDTNGAAYSAPQMDYRPIYYNRLSEAGDTPIWRTGSPWNAKETT